MAEKVLVRCDGMLVHGFPVQFKRPNDSAVKSQIPGITNGTSSTTMRKNIFFFFVAVDFVAI